MTDSTTARLSLFRERLRQVIAVLLVFLRNPIHGIKNPPQWEWPVIVSLQGGVAAACGLLAGIIAGSIMGVLAGIFIYPISAIVTVAVISGFFYYTFLFFFGRQIQFKQIYTLVVFANVPLLISLILTSLIPPLSIVGMAIVGILLVVGFVENFSLPRKMVIRLMGGLFFIYVALWMVGTINLKKGETQFRGRATPESLDILEKELQED